MRMGSAARAGSVEKDYSRKCRELSEWVRKTIDSKSKQARSALAKTVEQQKQSMREAHSKALSDLEKRMRRRLARVGRLEKRAAELQAALAKIDVDALKSELQRCKTKLTQKLEAKCANLERIKSEQERLLACELGKTLRKSDKLLADKGTKQHDEEANGTL
ncbi:hypothetical protein PAPHI01_1592 [Pancytospora philotis]|nr:hypothetical protein PAPHI01_1592 [Pancytospora philotis]